MRKLIGPVVIVFVLTWTSCNMAKTNSASLTFKELSYGVISAGGTSVVDDDDDKSPSGNTVKHTKLSVSEVTDTIIGEIGAVFGVNFILQSNVNAYIPVTRKWTFPSKIGDSSGEKVKSVSRQDVITTNSNQWMYYTLEQEYEIVKGKWMLQYFYKGQEIYKKTFILE